jgi:hypothetical protein
MSTTLLIKKRSGTTIGTDALEISLGDDATVADLKAQIAKKCTTIVIHHLVHIPPIQQWVTFEE